MKTMNELLVEHLRDLGYNGKTLQDSLYKFLKSEVPNTSMLMSINDLWAAYLEYQGFQGGVSKLYEYLYSLGYTQVSLNDRIVAMIAAPWQPSKFFAGGANGLWYRFANGDIGTLYQDTAMTVPVTADNDPVGAIVDKSGNNVNGLQAVSGERVTFKTSPNRINFDKVDDNIDINFGAAFSGTVYINTDDGLLSYEIDVPSGVWQLSVAPLYLHSNGFREIIAVARAANESDYNLVRQYTGAGVFAPAVSIASWFRARADIVSFFDYSLDVSGVNNFYQAWYGCSGLVSFLLLDVSNGDNFYQAWRGCSSLVNFPANFFDNCLATNFTQAFGITNLSQESIDRVLVSINSNGTSNGTFNQSGGNAPSAVGQAAIVAMRARGWTVTVTGGF